MNIAIVDDQEKERDHINSIILEYAAINSIDISITPYRGGEELIENYRPFAYTAVFMDIYMGGMTGIEAAKEILELDKHALIIFLTSSEDHMSSAFSIHAYDYIAKPAQRDRIFQVLDDLLMRVTEKTDEIFLKYQDGSEMVVIPCSQVLSVTTSKPNYLEIVDIYGEKRNARLTFSEVENTLSRDKRFLRIMRGIIVNMDCIIEIDNGVCVMEDGTKFMVSLRSEKELRHIWENYNIDCFRNERRGRRLRS